MKVREAGLRPQGTGDLKFLQLNGHKSSTVSSIVVNKLASPSNCVAMLQEPFISNKSPAGFGNSFQILHGGGDRPRAAIVATRDVNLWQRRDLSSPDVTTAILKTGKGNIYLASVYLDITRPLDRMFPEEMLTLVSKCHSRNLKLVLSIDSNSHSCLWGPDSNARGEVIEDLMACLLYTSPSPRDRQKSRMPSSA